MSLLIEKFNYDPISRNSENGIRLYQCPDGSKVPSVTTILDKTKPLEKKIALANWKKRVGEVKAQEIVTEAAGRGTRMHKYLEDYVKTGNLSDPGSNPYSQESHRMAKQIIEEAFPSVNEVWGCEVPLYYPGLYAGTTDCVGVHESHQSILDFKQTNKPKKQEWIEDYYLQLTAYALAHNKVHNTTINKGVVMMCVKPADPESKPQYQQFILENSDFAYWEKRWWDRVEEYYTQHG
jgi:genome maintenance exonuclease 1